MKMPAGNQPRKPLQTEIAGEIEGRIANKQRVERIAEIERGMENAFLINTPQQIGYMMEYALGRLGETKPALSKRLAEFRAMATKEKYLSPEQRERMAKYYKVAMRMLSRPA